MKKKTKITITATHGLVRALGVIEGEIEWLPMLKADIKKMRGFIPTAIERVGAMDSDGGCEVVIPDNATTWVLCNAPNKRGVKVRARR